MWRILILSSLSVCFSVVFADPKCSNVTSSEIPFSFTDEILMKLQMELNLMKTSDEVLRIRLEEMSLRLKQQTNMMNQILSKLGIDSGSNANSSRPTCCSCASSSQFPSSCDAITTKSGIYTIQVPSFSAQPFSVFCNSEEQGGGWTVVQRHVDDSVDFYRDWASYKVGFGDLNGNFWIGNDKLHALTTAAPQELLMILTDFDNITKIAKYDSVEIGDESEFYVLKGLGAYSGDAGDSFTYQKGMKFTTKDKDNDAYTSNCAVLYKGGWWYNQCHLSNLNGLYLKGAYPEDKYGQGMDWDAWHGHYYSLKAVSMMIRTKRK